MKLLRQLFTKLESNIANILENIGFWKWVLQNQGVIFKAFFGSSNFDSKFDMVLGMIRIKFHFEAIFQLSFSISCAFWHFHSSIIGMRWFKERWTGSRFFNFLSCSHSYLAGAASLKLGCLMREFCPF